MSADSDFALSQLKAEIDAALIELEVNQGLNHAHPLLVKAREAADNLFRTALLRKFNIEPQRTNYRELVESGALRGK